MMRYAYRKHSYIQETIRLIRTYKDKPFFIYLAHSMPHYPCHSSDGFVDSSDRGSYGDAVQEIDDGVGRIIQELKKQGIDKETLLVFTSFDADLTKNSRPAREVQ
jgi:arylsulfatase A